MILKYYILPKFMMGCLASHRLVMLSCCLMNMKHLQSWKIPDRHLFVYSNEMMDL